MAADITMASIKASNAARYLAMAAAFDMRGNLHNMWLEIGIEVLTETANALGYVLLRTGAEEASEEPAATETEVA